LKTTCSDAKAAEAAKQWIIGNSSMPFFGYCVPAHPGPPNYGGWSNTHRRFIRWRNKGIWTKLMLILSGEKDIEWLMMDATHIKVHPHAAGAKGGNEGMGRTKWG